jgi:hypothetical protein
MNTEQFLDPNNAFWKSEIRAILPSTRSAIRALSAGLSGDFWAGIGAKTWSKTKFSFFALQAIDFT